MPRILNGRYALPDIPVAKGGLANVYEAADLQGEITQVAVKVIKSTPDREGLLPIFFDREVTALRALQHPNIVRLLDAGREEQTGEYFLVLEWMTSDLARSLDSRKPLGWDDFIEEIGLPVLSGLAHAHERSIVHRDVKPSNVLLDSSGTPKLADFGISKIKSRLSGYDDTVAEFASRPFAPPEQMSTSDYNRDVFGFAVLTLSSVTEGELRDYPDIQPALDQLDAPPGIISIIERCVSFDPLLRPQNAQVLLVEIESVQRQRRKAWAAVPTIHLMLTKGAALKASEGKTQATGSVEKAVASDLQSGAYVERQSEGGGEKPKLSDSNMWLYGESWRYLGTTQWSPPSIAIVSAKKLSLAQMDVARDHSWSPEVSFVLGPPLNYQVATDSLRLFLEQLDEFHEKRDQERAKRESERLFTQWRNQLLAKEAVEYSRGTPLRFLSATQSGRRISFSLAEAPETDIVGQRWAVKPPQGRFTKIRGEVENVAERRLTLYLDRETDQVPQRGELVVDTHESLVALDRQMMALDALRFGSSLVEREDLRNLILNPSSNREPTPIGISNWFQSELDDDKKVAVQLALGSPDFLLVEGPPRTGKTTLIAESIAQEISRTPGIRILVASQTHVALDNALERLTILPQSPFVVRLGRATDPRISEGVRSLLLENQLQTWAKVVRKRSEDFLEGWAHQQNLNLASVRQVLALSELATIKDTQSKLREAAEALEVQIQQGLDLRESDPTSAPNEDDLDSLQEQLNDLRQRAARVRREGDRISESLAKPLKRPKEELMRASGDEVRQITLAMATQFGATLSDQLKAIVELQAEWLQRVGSGAEFEGPLLYSAQVVAGTCIGLAGTRAVREIQFDLCIIDEATKATATEALVPLVRAKRWTLIGDPNQLPPFQEEALMDQELIARFQMDTAELGHTLFDRLLAGLPSTSKVRLLTQHRMAKPIGDLISKCFYGGELRSATGDGAHELDLAIPKPVLWINTHNLLDRKERVAGPRGLSFVSPCEAKQVVEFLERLSWVAKQKRWAASRGRPLRVLVLSGYRPQVDAIRQRVDAAIPKLLDVAIEVNTVDAAQGREADVVVFSVTRSNPEGNPGFLASSPRVNVALSRGKYGLVIVGDLEFSAITHGILADVASYVREDSSSCAVVRAE